MVGFNAVKLQRHYIYSQYTGTLYKIRKNYTIQAKQHYLK